MSQQVRDRDRTARWLAWRVERRTPAGPRPLHWTLLGSVWVHLLIAGLLLSQVSVERRIEVVRLVPTEAVAARALEPEGPPEGRAESRPAPRVEEQSLPPAPPLQDAVRVARTERRDAVERAPDRWDAESRWNTVAEQARRRPVSSDHLGPPTAPSQGERRDAGQPTLERRPGDEQARAGNAADAARADATAGGGGGGQLGRGHERGAASPGGPRLAAGPAGGGRAGGPGSPDPGAPVTAPDGPDPTRAKQVAAPAWWDPIAARITVSPAPPAASAPAPVPLTGPARRERPGEGGDVGSAAVAEPDGAALPGAPASHAGTRRVAAPGTGDPAEELRRALGMAPIDRSRLAPAPTWSGRIAADGAADSSPQTTFEAPVDWRTSLSTKGTPLGAYVQQVEQLVAERWRATDLDPHLRAIGIAGDVTVRYVVHPDGRTSDVRVVVSSGNPALDAMAVGAIPSRLPRFPRELARDAIHHEIELRYRNPLLAIGPE